MYRKVSQSQDEDGSMDVELEAYNEQYSLIIQLARQFLEQAKQSIHKYLQKSKFPTYLNKGIVSKWAVDLQGTLNDPDKFKTRKEKEFSEILIHLRRNIHEMIQFEKTFKKEFHQSMNRNSKNKNNKPINKSLQSTECSKFQKKQSKLRQQIQSQSSKADEESLFSESTSHQDEKLRKQLRIIVLPKQIDFGNVPEDDTTGTVLKRLTMKLQKMNNAMDRQKQRQKNILGIFQKRKIIVTDVNTQIPAVFQLSKQIQQLKQTINQKDQAIRFLQSKMSAMDKDRIVVERYIIPKSEKNLSNFKGGIDSKNGNISFEGSDFMIAPQSVGSGFKKDKNSQKIEQSR